VGVFTVIGETRSGRRYSVTWDDGSLDGDREMIDRFMVTDEWYGLSPTGPFLPADATHGASVIAFLGSTTRVESVTGDFPADAVAPPLPEGAVG
jgi:hypothetical protein